MMTEDEPLPSRTEPASMDFQAPLHTPYGTAERTYEGFWGAKNPLLERRELLPDYAVTEYEWDRNPRECGKRRSEFMAQPYEHEGSVAVSAGADLGRTIDVKEASITQYMRYVQKTNPTAYGADPVIGQGAGGGVPVLMPYLGKKGSSKPLFSPGYTPPAGGAMPAAPPVEPGMQLPSATRGNRQYELHGNVTGGNAVSSYGDESINPQRGGRPSLLATEYEHWGHRNGGFVSGGGEWDASGSTIWNPNDGARFRNVVDQDGATEPIMTGSYISEGPSLDRTPKVGGRESKLINFDMTLAGGATTGIGSSLTQNPQAGGRASRYVNWETIGSGGALAGVGSGLQHNPQEGGRMPMLINFDTIIAGGASSGVGSGLQHNPQEGGRTTKLINFDTTHAGGATSGVGSSLQHNPQEGGRTTRLINFSIINAGGTASGVGSSLQHNPQEGGRATKLINFDTIHAGGAQSGVSGIECSDIVGGNHWARTEGCSGYLSPGGSLNPDYGGCDVAFGLEVQPRAPRTETISPMLPGCGGRGCPKMPDMFVTLPNTQINGEGIYDDSPDPVLQISARSTLGSKALLDFTRANIDDLSFVIPCI